MRDRTFENQRYRASGLNLVVAAIILWNTVYLERAIRLLQQRGRTICDAQVRPKQFRGVKPSWVAHDGDRSIRISAG